METQYEDYQISTDISKLNIEFVHNYLCYHSYWAAGIPESIVRQSIEGALCFGVFHKRKQVGFARIISDYATIAYMGDLFIDEDYRGRGLSKWLLENMIRHPKLQGLRRWILATADAHSLYEQFGFTTLSRPERWMERANSKVYQSK